jgi:hypothetical protein
MADPRRASPLLDGVCPGFVVPFAYVSTEDIFGGSVGDLFAGLFGPSTPAEDWARRAPIDAAGCVRDTAAAIAQRPELQAENVARALANGRVELLLGDERRVQAHVVVAPEDLPLVRNHHDLVREEMTAVVERSGYSLYALGESASVNEPPPSEPPRPLRRGEVADAITNAVAEGVKAYDIAEFCVGLGLEPPQDDDPEPFSSKRIYVRRKLAKRSIPELLDIAARVLQEFDAPDLDWLLASARGGVGGHAKNLIFATVGPKPRIVLGDAINNDAIVVENEEFCLVYDRPIPDSGLTWGALVTWFGEKHGIEDDSAAAKALYERLAESLQDSAPERLVLRVYAHLCKQLGSHLPALVPQVYLHYDPYTQRERGECRYLIRERMDFLLLLPVRRRVVVEIDGRHHYADDDGRAEPKRYAEMVAADRELRLLGYEVYRFGGYEFMDERAAIATMRRFFGELLNLPGG